jgi:hypothetical protein
MALLAGGVDHLSRRIIPIASEHLNGFAAELGVQRKMVELGPGPGSAENGRHPLGQKATSPFPPSDGAVGR